MNRCIRGDVSIGHVPFVPISATAENRVTVLAMMGNFTCTLLLLEAVDKSGTGLTVRRSDDGIRRKRYRIGEAIAAGRIDGLSTPSIRRWSGSSLMRIRGDMDASAVATPNASGK